MRPVTTTWSRFVHVSNNRTCWQVTKCQVKPRVNDLKVHVKSLVMKMCDSLKLKTCLINVCYYFASGYTLVVPETC